MTTQTSLVAEQVRLQQWAEQIRDCRNRPEGMKVETWCAKNNITKANYYYHLRRVREAYLEQRKENTPDFIEVPMPTERKTSTPPDKLETENSINLVPVMRIKNKDGISAEVFSNTSPEMLVHLIEAFNHVK